MDSINIAKTPLDGVTEITAAGWDGRILVMSREIFIKFSREKFLDLAGVYVIYADHYDKKRYGRAIYIGQGDSVAARLESHSKEKPFWNKVLIFTSLWMNVAYAFNVELDFINSAKMANRYEVDNTASGQSKKLGEQDLQRCSEYIKSAKLVIKMANIDIFSYNEDGVYSCSDRMVQASVKIVTISPKRVLVLAGSKFDTYFLDAQAIDAYAISDALEKDNRWMVFAKDVELDIVGDVLPKLCGFHLSKFRSGCGVGLDRAFRSLSNEDVHDDS